MYKNIAVVVVGSVIALFLWAAFTQAPVSELSVSIRPPFPGCRWSVVDGAGLKVRVQECLFPGNSALPDRHVRVAASESLPGYFVEVADGQEAYRATALVIQVFRKEPNVGIESLLSRIQDDPTYPYGAECEFTVSKRSLILGKTRYQLVPVGLSKAYFDAQMARGDEVPQDPCGSYGYSVSGERYFEVQAAHPETVLFINAGQEQPLFDENNIVIVQ